MTHHPTPQNNEVLRLQRRLAKSDMRRAELEHLIDTGQAGLDALRAIAHGADFVMLGRAWHYGLGAFGAKGAEQVLHILKDDMASALGQMGLGRPEEARQHRL